jgi:glycosyltransferase involved in cell wall biosynthesis
MNVRQGLSRVSDPAPGSSPAVIPDAAFQPGLTVVILTYNSAATLGGCLDSLVCQADRDFGVVVVDDDSTDETLAIVASYSSRLRITVTRNGSHVIPRGRNIGLTASQTSVVAFIDSDDRADPGWTRAIGTAFRDNPGIAMISGVLVPAYRTRIAQAIALNDDAIRRLFGSIVQVSAGNCAINRDISPDVFFDEDFRFAEDLELASRIGARHQWKHIPSMRVQLYSRETFGQYARQMYRYGFMKQYFSFTARTYRWVDYVPLALLIGSGLAGLALQSWWPLLLIVPFSLLEALFVICYQRCPATVAALTTPAWLVKNLSWSCGIAHGLVALAADRDTRRLLRAKRPAAGEPMRPRAAPGPPARPSAGPAAPPSVTQSPVVPAPVVHVTPHYPPFLGGLEKVVESLAAHRRGLGLPVQVLTARDGAVRVAGPDEADPDEADYVRRLRSWNVAHTAVIPGLLRELVRLPRETVIHLHISQAFLPEAVLAAHLRRKLPYLAHLHLDFGPSGRGGFLLRAYKPLLLGPVLRAAACVVVFTTEQRAAVISRYCLDPARVAVLPNGVHQAFFCAGQRLLHEKPRLLFVGRLSVQKNIPLLLHALDGVSERFETTLVGDGDQGRVLRETADRLRLQNVRFHGRADGAELRGLYRDADVFVLPSEREGMPLVLLEALAAGLPIVATDIPGNRDVVVHGRTGLLIPPGDPARLRQALLEVTSDAQRYQRMSEAARACAARYSWTSVGAEFERLYAQAASPAGPNAAAGRGAG